MQERQIRSDINSYFVTTFKYLHDSGLLTRSYSSEVISLSAAYEPEIVFQQIFSESKELSEICDLVFGQWVLQSNYFRYLIRPSIDELINTLSKSMNELMDCTPRFINRPIYAEGDAGPEAVGLIAHAFTEVISGTLSEISRLKKARDLSMTYEIPESTQLTKRDIQSLWKSLGFIKAVNESIPFANDYTITEEISESLLSLTRRWQRFFSLLKQQTTEPASLVKIVRSIQKLSTTVRSLRSDSPAVVDVDGGFDSSSVDWVQSIVQIEIHCRDFLTQLNELVSLIALNKKDVVTNDIARLTAFELIKLGQKPVEAYRAGRNLVSYCRKNNVILTEINPIELQGIHGSLTIELLSEIKRKYPSLNFKLFESASKETILEKIKSLKIDYARITSALSILALFLPLCFITVGCGVKTQPKSSLIDLKPDIPYRNAVSPKKSKTKSER